MLLEAPLKRVSVARLTEIKASWKARVSATFSSTRQTAARSPTTTGVMRPSLSSWVGPCFGVDV